MKTKKSQLNVKDLAALAPDLREKLENIENCNIINSGETGSGMQKKIKQENGHTFIYGPAGERYSSEEINKICSDNLFEAIQLTKKAKENKKKHKKLAVDIF